MVAEATELLPNLTELKIHIRLPQCMKPISAKMKEALQQYMVNTLRDSKGECYRKILYSY